MALDDFLNAIPRSTQPTPEPQEDANMFTDIVAAPFRGVEGAVQSLYDLADFATGDDLLPDYDSRFLGRSKTFAGGMVEGVSQFLTGFVPVAGQLSKVGKLSKAAKGLKGARGARKLNLKGNMAAGAVADFSVFQSQEDRLSNLIESFPTLSNPISEFLAADDSDGELEGRLKNTLEGLALGGVVDGLISGVKALKKARNGDDPRAILEEYQNVVFSGKRDDKLLQQDFDSTDTFRASLSEALGRDVAATGEPVTAFDLLSRYTQGYDGELAPLFKSLLSVAPESLKNTVINFTEGGGSTFKSSVDNATGQAAGTITMGKGGVRTLAHELMHATTLHKLNTEIKYKTDTPAEFKTYITEVAGQSDNAVSGLARTYLKAIEKLGLDEKVFGEGGIAGSSELHGAATRTADTPYAFTNIAEFISEAFSNEEFRLVLSAMEGDVPKKSVFDELLAAVKGMLGLNATDGSLLDDVFKYTGDVVSEQNRMFDEQFSFLKDVDQLHGQTYRTLDDRGSDFTAALDEEGLQVRNEKGEFLNEDGEVISKVAEMQGDDLRSTRPVSRKDFTLNFGSKEWRGKKVSEVPSSYLKKSLEWDSVTTGMKEKIELELQARKDNGEEIFDFDTKTKTKYTTSQKKTAQEKLERLDDYKETKQAIDGKTGLRKTIETYKAQLEKTPSSDLPNPKNAEDISPDKRQQLEAKIKAAEDNLKIGEGKLIRMEKAMGGKTPKELRAEYEDILNSGRSPKETKPEGMGGKKEVETTQRIEELEARKVELEQDMTDAPLNPEAKALTQKVQTELRDVESELAELKKTTDKQDAQRELFELQDEKRRPVINPTLREAYRNYRRNKAGGLANPRVESFKEYVSNRGLDVTTPKQKKQKVRNDNPYYQEPTDQQTFGQASIKEINSIVKDSYGKVPTDVIEGMRPSSLKGFKDHYFRLLDPDPFVGKELEAARELKTVTQKVEAALKEVNKEGIIPEYATTQKKALTNALEEFVGAHAALSERGITRIDGLDKIYTNADAVLRDAGNILEQEKTFGQAEVKVGAERKNIRGRITALLVNGDVGEDFGPDGLLRPDVRPDAPKVEGERGRDYDEYMALKAQEAELENIQAIGGDITELLVNGDVGEDFGPDAQLRLDRNPDAPKVEGERGRDYDKYMALKAERASLEEAYVAKYGSSEESSKTVGQAETLKSVEEEVASAITRLAKTMATGGDQAIMSAARNISSSRAAVGIISAIAENMKNTGVKGEKVTAESLTAETKEMVDLLGGNENTWLDAVERLKAAGGTSLADFRTQQRAAKTLIDLMSRDLVDLAKEANAARKDPSKNLPQLEAKVLSAVDQLTEVQRIWSLMGKEAGLSLVQRKFLDGSKGGYRLNKDVGFDFISRDPSEYAKYTTETAGTMDVQDVINKLIMAGSDADVAKAIGQDAAAAKRMKAVGSLTSEMKGGKAMNMVTEYWMNSLLSGPATQAVNILGSALTSSLRIGELAFGGLLRGDPDVARAVLGFAFKMENIREAFAFAGKAWDIEDSVLTRGSVAFNDANKRTDAITGRNATTMLGEQGAKVGAKQLDTIESAVDAIGKGVRLPSRGLMTVDEFFKQLNYRSYVRTNLAYEGIQAGIKDGKELAAFVEGRFQNYVTKGGRAYNEANVYLDAVETSKTINGLEYGGEQAAVIQAQLAQNPFDPSRGGLADAALEYAKVNTFTNDLESDSIVGTLGDALGKLKTKIPILNFVVPFINTPTNILKFALDRTPIGVATDLSFRRKKLTDALTNTDPMIQAQAAGKLATSTAVVGTAMWYMASNKEFITGGGPRTQEEKEALQLTGWQPYSIKVGDKWLSYQRLDPMATVIGLFADLAEAEEYYDLDDTEMGNMFSAVALSFSNNITNKSYVKGLDSMLNMLRDPAANSKALVGNIAGGFVPTFLSQGQNYSDERVLRETRTIFDYMLKKSPASGSLPAKRNFLGEAIKYENLPMGAGIFNPIYFSSESDDIVDQELASLSHGFNKQDSKIGGALQTKDIYNKEGRQAYDVWLEKTGTTKINGKNLRQTLRKLVSSKEYQALQAHSSTEIGEKSPRIRTVNNWLRAFRGKARAEMLQEFPDLQNSLTELTQEKQQYRLIQ